MANPVQQWDAQLYDTQHAIITRYGEALVDLLNPQAGERVLDLGCGTGHLTAQIAEKGAQVIGLDKSESMIETARAAYPNIEFMVGDAADFAFDQPFDAGRIFDAVFSNAALHWVLDAAGVARSVYHALKPNGRFIAEMGGKTNIGVLLGEGVFGALDALSLPRPEGQLWYFPSPAEHATLLESHGFRVSFMAHFDRPTLLQGEDGIRHWLAQFVPAILDSVPADLRDRFVREVEDRTRARLYRDGNWYADYVRLRFVAVRL